MVGSKFGRKHMSWLYQHEDDSNMHVRYIVNVTVDLKKR